VAGNPWLAIGAVIGLLLVGAWIAWTVHVWSDHGSRQGLGVLIVWPAILTVLAVIAIPFVWAFRVIRANARSDEPEEEAEPESPEDEASEDESGAEASAAG
jgi:type VI protein secretion system component VasK